MMHSSVKVQIAPSSVPTTPSWLGEVAVVAHVLTQFGILDAIQQRVQFARVRFGQYDTIDFLVILIGYAVSGELTLKAFYERLWPFAPTFMALFGRSVLPCHSTLSLSFAVIGLLCAGATLLVLPIIRNVQEMKRDEQAPAHLSNSSQ
jgi:hypothetical protein